MSEYDRVVSDSYEKPFDLEKGDKIIVWMNGSGFSATVIDADWNELLGTWKINFRWKDGTFGHRDQSIGRDRYVCSIEKEGLRVNGERLIYEGGFAQHHYDADGIEEILSDNKE
jgi:hypothetical protein